MKPSSLQTATDYRPALLWLMGELTQARTAEVIAEFERRLGDLIPSEHYELNSSDQAKWDNYTRWARQALVNVNLMGSGGRGIWTITPAGQAWLREHPDGGKDALVALIRDKRKNDAATKKSLVRPASLQTATDYRPALLWLMDELEQGRAFEIVAEFERRLRDLIPPEHYELNPSDQVKWENYTRWSRHDLANAGLMGSGGRGIWTITQAGQAWLREHPDGGKDALVALIREKGRKKQPRSAPDHTKHSIQLAGETFELSQADVLDAVRTALSKGTPPEAERFISWFLPVDGKRLSVKWVVSLVTGLPRSRFGSPQARNQLNKLGLAAQPVDRTAAAPTADEAAPQPAELTREDFYRAVLARMAGKLPPGVSNRRINPQVNYLKLTCPAPSTHYELYMRRRYTEIAIHFEGRRDRSLALLDQFRSHLEALEKQLGEPIYAEPWGKNWAKVYLKRPPPWLDAPTAEALADDWLRFIEATLPVVTQATANLGLRAERGRSATVKEKDLDRPKTILAQTIREIRAYLNGDGSLAPSDEKLCEWVQFCYTFELSAEAVRLSKLVRAADVNPWLYERTRKLARACELRMKR